MNDTKLDDCHNIPTKPLYALILTPTRELAIQIKNHLTQAAKYTDVKVKLSFSKSTDLLKYDSKVIVSLDSCCPWRYGSSETRKDVKQGT